MSTRRIRVLPPQHRLRSSALFRQVVKRGTKKGTKRVLVYVLVDHSGVTFGGPRVGLIVSKAVGNAVTRHAVSRRLRAGAAGVLTQQPDGLNQAGPGTLIVIRALPAAAGASTKELEADVRNCIRRALA